MRARLIIGGLFLPVWLFSLGADVMSIAAKLPPPGLSARYISAVAVHYAFYALLLYPLVYFLALPAALWLKEKGKDVGANRVAAIPLLVPLLPLVLVIFASAFQR